MTAKKDIENREDIELLISAFYDRMLKDMVLGYIFTDIAKVDLEEHIPVICDFWENVIFNRPVYKRGSEVMDVHINLNRKIQLRRGHFRRWLYLFKTTLDELFEGAMSTRARDRADSIALQMQRKLSI